MKYCEPKVGDLVTWDDPKDHDPRLTPECIGLVVHEKGNRVQVHWGSGVVSYPQKNILEVICDTEDLV